MQQAQVEGMQERTAEVKMVLGLQLQDVAPVNAILQRRPELAQSAEEILGAVKAKSTLQGYGSAIEKFKKFLREDSTGEGITEEVLIQYVLQLNKEKASYAVICQTQPAIRAMMQMAGLDESVFTSRVGQMLDGAKRLAAERR